MYDIQIKTTKETDKMLRKFPKDTENALFNGVKQAIHYAESESKKSFGQAGNLKSRSGTLRNSIRGSVRKRGHELVAKLSSKIKYARIHELGGVIKARSKPYLKFQIAGKWITVKQVVIPARPYLRPAIWDNRRKMATMITNVVANTLNKG